MVPDRQKVWTDGRLDGMDGRTDDAKTISLRLCRGITKKNLSGPLVISLYNMACNEESTGMVTFALFSRSLWDLKKCFVYNIS